MERSQVRLVPLTGEQVEWLQEAIADGYTLDAEAHSTLAAIVTAYEAGITKHEAEALKVALADVWVIEADYVEPPHEATRIHRKLRTAFNPTERQSVTTMPRFGGP